MKAVVVCVDGDWLDAARVLSVVRPAATSTKVGKLFSCESSKVLGQQLTTAHRTTTLAATIKWCGQCSSTERTAAEGMTASRAIDRQREMDQTTSSTAYVAFSERDLACNLSWHFSDPEVVEAR